MYKSPPARRSSWSAEIPRAGLLRRIAAMVYDALLLLAVWFFAALPLPLIPDPVRLSVAGRLTLQCYLIGVAALFFGWFWTHGGQTLGLRAWRMKVVAMDGEEVGWQRAARRFGAAILSVACLGLGFAPVVLNRNRLAWHDRWSGTQVVLLSREKPRG